MVSFTGFNVVVICWLVFMLVWFVSAFFVKRSAVKRRWGLQVLWRLGLILAVILLVRVDRAGVLASVTFLFSPLFSLAVSGAVLTVLGLLCALWSRVALGRNWSGYVTYKEEHELVTSGPYRLVRHPMYASILLMAVGAVLYYGYLFLVAAFALAAAVFLWRMGREERIMLKLFGERYAGYMKRTKRLIPFIY